jgi:hypothetical protein
MTKHTCSILLAFLLFAAPVWAQMAQPIEARKPSNNPPEVQSNGCRFQDHTYCAVFAQHPRGRINVPRRHQVDTFGPPSVCRGRRALVGTLVGAGIGATVGAVGSTKYNSRGNSIAQGAVLLGLIGLAVGSATGCH